jgi:hypothetical protein
MAKYRAIEEAGRLADKQIGTLRAALKGRRTMTAIDDIAAERQRQKDVEGWSPEHDDAHTGGELLRAAICYAQHPITHPMALRQLGPGKPCDMWPWEASWWKPKNPRRDLVRAAALIVAEIERLDRATDQSK